MGARQEGGFGAWITKRYLHVGSATHSRGRKRDEVAVTLRARALNRVCGTALPCGTAGALPPHAISCLGFSGRRWAERAVSSSWPAAENLAHKRSLSVPLARIPCSINYDLPTIVAEKPQ